MDVGLRKQELVALLDEENALDADRGVCVADVVVRAEMLDEKGEDGEQLRFRELGALWVSRR